MKGPFLLECLKWRLGGEGDLLVFLRFCLMFSRVLGYSWVSLLGFSSGFSGVF